MIRIHWVLTWTKVLTIISFSYPTCIWNSVSAVATHSSTLAWKIPWSEEPGRLQSRGSQRVGHDWATSLSLSCIGEGNGNPLRCSCLENPKDEGAWWAAVYGVTQSRTRLKRLSSSSSSSRWKTKSVIPPLFSSQFGFSPSVFTILMNISNPHPFIQAKSLRVNLCFSFPFTPGNQLITRSCLFSSPK